jgi:tetraacyldisaccharide 4'-kinase
LTHHPAQPPLILASASPRRAQLLTQANLPFRQITPPFDDATEHFAHLPPLQATRDMALAKARSAAPLINQGLILACDTLVALGPVALGKPTDEAHARRMIASLLDRDHQVISAVCLLDAATGRHHLFDDTATVHIAHPGHDELEHHFSHDAGAGWRGKAGGYNLAQLPHWPITVTGDPTTVVGLPMLKLLPELARFQASLQPPSPSTPITPSGGGGRSPLLPSWAIPLAAGAEPIYRGLTSLRNGLYNRRLLLARRAHVPVISVGNLTTGGTGKTPMVIWLAQHLLAAGHQPAIVLRGYRKKPGQLSDEQALYHASLPHVPVVADPDRLAAAVKIRADHPGVDVIVLDDAFQHRRIARDLDLVLIDATNPWGFGHVLPRGLMRESPASLRRADAVIVTRSGEVDAAALHALDTQIAHHHGSWPLAHAAHVWDRLVDEQGHTVQPADPAHPSAPSVLAFSGIGNPAAFFQQARSALPVAATLALPDHVHYDPPRLRQLLDLAARFPAAAFVTTAKDWVKLRPLVQSRALPLPVWHVEMSLRLLDGAAALSARIAAVFAHTSSPPAASPP